MLTPQFMVILCRSRSRNNCSQILYKENSVVICIVDAWNGLAGIRELIHLLAMIHIYIYIAFHSPVWHSRAGCCYWEIEAADVIKSDHTSHSLFNFTLLFSSWIHALPPWSQPAPCILSMPSRAVAKCFQSQPPCWALVLSNLCLPPNKSVLLDLVY